MVPIVRTAFFIILLAFLVGLAATMSTPEKYHGDEMFYTDAAIRMCQSGDYWTPYWDHGGIRLRKPIMTYWTIAGSFQLFGISIFASRLPALLAGAGLLALTFLTGRTVFKSSQIAMLAMLITASNLEMMRLATRATPDALLCFFVTLSMYGFARIWFEQDRGWWGPLLAFCGMGLAVQTKGLLGLVPLLANTLFFVLARPGPSGLRALRRPVPLVIGLSLAVFWYAVMIQRHGVGALREFFDDQVSAKVSSSPLFLLSNPFVYCVAVIQYYPIWALILAGCAIFSRNEMREFWRQNRSQCVFLLSLLVLAIVLFSFGNVRRSRYLTVAYPLVACALAGAIHSLAGGQAAQRRLVRAGIGIGLLLALGGLLAMIYGLWIGPRWGVGGALLLGLGVAGVMVARSEDALWRWSWICAVFLVGFVAHGACFRPFLSPSPLPKLTRELQAMKPEPSTIYVYEAQSRVPGIIRILSGGNLKVQTITSIPAEGTNSFPSPIVAPNPEALRKANYTLVRIEPDTPLPPATKLGQAARSRVFWIGLRNPNPGAD
jgi:4-amino-4-deoxy-L-arabinose transferase-like glycosyltransferase